jgi:glycosyltransferase involved in cell wall biosynthesis
MRVALINNWPISSGVGRYAIALYNSLRRNGVEVDHYFTDREKWAIYKISNGKSEFIRKAKRNPLVDNPIFMKLKLSNLFLDYRLGKHIPTGYDLYHITNQNMSVLNYYSNISTNVITVHDIAYFKYHANPLKKIFSRLVYRGIKYSDFLIAVSNSTKNDLINYFTVPEEKIRVIHHGVDSAFKPLAPKDVEEVYTKYNIDKNCRYILHVGGNAPRKNLPVLIKAFHRLINGFKIKNVKLLKINNMDRELIRRLKIEKYVKIIDYVPEEDLPKFYNLADVFVFPSIYEGFGFPPLEAMACGTPVITSNASSLPEVVGGAGIMLDPNDVDGFAKAMYNVLTDEGLRQEMIKRGLERVKKFSWDKAARETLEVYKEVVER